MTFYENDESTGANRSDEERVGAACGDPDKARAATGIVAITPMSEETKVCPYCTERVPIRAVKCRYCGSALTKC